MNVYIEDNELFYPEIKYIFNIFCLNKNIDYSLTQSYEKADCIISTDVNADIRISIEFFNLLKAGKNDYNLYFIDQCCYVDPNGFMDYLSSAFYILNTIQEINHSDIDQYGRFKYKNSFQFKFDNVKINIVQNLFDKIFQKVSKFGKFKSNLIKSKIFLSHDIDSLNGSLLQDSYYSIRKFRPDLLIKIILLNLFKQPQWFNIDKIMKIESEYSFYSTFYWLVNRGRTTYGLNNSDYDINNSKVRFYINKIENSNWENGLHKSASDESFETEILKLNCNVKGNRYHYLRFNPDKDYNVIEKSNLKFDSSLGFAEVTGFRSGYGLPFRPYSFTERRAFNFVECPLHIMDTTYSNYKKVDAAEFFNEVIGFLELNKYNSIISVLFHNNYLTPYKFNNYFKAIKMLLAYFYESDFKCITQSEIIKIYYNEYKD